MELVIQLFTYNLNNAKSNSDKHYIPIRQEEINTCLITNLHNPIFNKLHILCESDKDMIYYKNITDSTNYKDKCKYVVFGSQPKYADLVWYVNDNIKDNTIVCIQNSDIYLTHDISYSFIENILRENMLIALTRHEETTDIQHTNCNESTCPLIYNYMGSHDSFIFKTPVPNNFPYNSVAIIQNCFGSEAVFMKAWVNAGKKLINPCFDIKIIHKHLHRYHFKNCELIADGYLCNISPCAPEGRDDIKLKLKTLFK